MNTATPTKLRDGSWGARVPGRAREGQAVTVRTRAGKTWTAHVSRVLWVGEDRRTGETISLCATSSSSSRRRGRRTGCSCGSREDQYGEVIPSPHNCRSCQFEAINQ